MFVTLGEERKTDGTIWCLGVRVQPTVILRVARLVTVILKKFLRKGVTPTFCRRQSLKLVNQTNTAHVDEF